MARVVILMTCLILPGVSLASGQSAPSDAQNQPAPSAPSSQPAIVVESDSRLPETYPRAAYEYRFHAHGGVPPLHWRLEKGALPPGMTLQDDGLLTGQAQRAGEFQFTLS